MKNQFDQICYVAFIWQIKNDCIGKYYFNSDFVI